MNINLEEILAELEPKEPEDRGSTSIWISQAIWSEFKLLTGEKKASKTLEKLMEGYINAVRAHKAKP